MNMRPPDNAVSSFKLCIFHNNSLYYKISKDILLWYE